VFSPADCTDKGADKIAELVFLEFTGDELNRFTFIQKSVNLNLKFNQ